MYFNGKQITQSDFRNLRKGDLFWITDENEVRIFERFAKCFTKRGEMKVVNTLGKVNHLEYMRWLTEAERCKHFGVNPSPAKKQHVGEVVPQDYDVYENKKESGVKMSSAMSVVSKQVETMKSDAVDASYRTAAKQLLKSARVPLQAFLSKQKLPSSALTVVNLALQTENGEAAFALLLGTAMNYLPSLTRDPKVERLAKELRVYGMDNFLSQIADAVLEPLRASILEVVKQLPFGNSDQ